jgi:hypothetical protein
MRVVGAVAGAILAGHAVPYFAVAAGPQPLPMVVDASLVRSGEVGMVDSGLLLVGAEVDPGPAGSAEGRLGLASETPVPVAVTLQDVGLPSGLEEQIWLRITLGDVVVFQGTQAQLRHTPSQPFLLAPGAVVPIGITVSLPADGSAAAHGRHIELRLQVLSPVAAD